MKKCKIIMNPQSGKKKNTNFMALYDILRKYGYDGEIIFTKKSKDAIDIVKNLDDDVNLVIAAGGDGTLHEVVEGNMLRKKYLTFADLPLGTVNDVGNMIGLTRNTLKNLELLLSGEPKKVDVCYINDTPFVYVACLGDYIDMAYATPRELKSRYGKLGYIIYGIKQFLTNGIHKYKIKYKVNGETYEDECSFFFISNSSRIAGFNDLYYDMKLNDNMFEVALAKVKDKKELFKTLISISTSDMKDVKGITYYRTNEIEIEFLDTPKSSWCIDGEEFESDSNTFKFKVVKGPKMLMPKENIKHLIEE